MPMFTCSYRSSLSSMFLAGLLAALLGPAPGFAATITVNTADDDNVNGDQACSLREAVDNANFDYGANIDCAAGTVGMDVIEIQNGLGTMQLAHGEIEVRRTMRIVGPPARQIISAVLGSRIFHADFTLATPGFVHEVRLENLELRDGRETSLPVACGGAVLLDDRNDVVIGRAVLDNVVFRDNLAETGTARGGGLCADDVDEVVIRNSRFDNNRVIGAGSEGGAVFARGGYVRMENVHVENNQALGNSAKAGALMLLEVDTFALVRSTLRGNSATTSGRASTMVFMCVIHNTIADSVFQANGAVDGADQPRFDDPVIEAGGCAGAQGLLVSNSWFNQNRGTVLDVDQGEFHLGHSTISGTMATGANASALELSLPGDARVVSSSIVNNLGDSSAVVRFGHSMWIENSTIAHNVATSAGKPGGIEAWDGWVRMHSSMVVDNSGSEGNVLAVPPASRFDADYTLFGDAAAEVQAGSHNLFHDDGGLGILADYGCALRAGANLVDAPVCVPLRAIDANSPALDRGDDHGQAYDQRGPGFARAVGPVVNVADMGAYEFQSPQISIEAVDANRAEGSSGTTMFRFRLLRTGDTRAQSTVAWLPEGAGTNPADAGDFPPSVWAGGTILFAVGQTEVLLDVAVTGDSITEPNEGFRVSLGSMVNGRPGSASGADGTIINDDAIFPSAVLSLTRRDADLYEGQYFTSTHRFRVTRAQVTSGTCSFQLEVLAGSGPFVPDAADFVGWVPGVPATFVMLPGNTHWDIDVSVAGDSALEFDETFELRLQNASGCGIDLAANQVSATIRNDDSSLWIETITASAPEGNLGSSSFSMMIHRGTSDLNPASVSWSTSGTGMSPATADDFAGGSFPAGVAQFAAGQSTVLIALNVAGDTVVEPDQGFRVTLSNPAGGDIYPTDHADAIIVDDDAVGPGLIFRDSFE